MLIVAPRGFHWFFGRFGGRVIEPDIKLIFAVLFGIMLLAQLGNSQAVLPVFILGLVLSRTLHRAQRPAKEAPGHRVRHRHPVLLPQGRDERIAGRCYSRAPV